MQHKFWCLVLSKHCTCYLKTWCCKTYFQYISWNHWYGTYDSCLLIFCPEIIDYKVVYILWFLIFNALLFCKPVVMHLQYEILQFLTLYFYMIDLATIQFPQKNPGLAERLLASCCEVSIKWLYYIFLVGRCALCCSCH